MANIADLLDILAKPERVSVIIGDELAAVKAEFGQSKKGERRSTIEYNAQDLGDRRPDHATDMVVTLSHTGYIKSQPLSEYRAQKRGGRGKQATRDQGRRLDRPAVHRQHARLPLCFSNRGRMYWLKVWEVPSGLAQLAWQAHRQTCSRCKKARRSTWCCR